ncbi:hypothetical protein HMPREF9071_1563 [Capnocytophaga sp. oral taxon 338 str. F0234]|nr:hypothetical protein HMPREF9071_1563 [Capnocytophaga sp. oral taxon 338 str. F0234]
MFRYKITDIIFYNKEAYPFSGSLFFILCSLQGQMRVNHLTYSAL